MYGPSKQSLLDTWYLNHRVSDLVGNGSSRLVGATVPHSQAWTERAPRRLNKPLPEPPNEQGGFLPRERKVIILFFVERT